MTALTEQIKATALARAKVADAGNAVKEIYEKWLKDTAPLHDILSQSGKMLVAQEDKLRELTLQAYAETGNKKPAEGVGVREVSRLEYDTDKALAYAKEHGVALKLDIASFEKMAKIPELRPSFVQAHTEPQATIASDLSFALKGDLTDDKDLQRPTAPPA